MILWPWRWIYHWTTQIPRTLRSLIFCLHKELLEDAAVAASLDEDEELSKVAMKAVTQLVKSALDINTSWYGKYTIVYKVFYIPGVADFFPYIVS